MHIVKIEVRPMSEGKKTTATLIIERKRNEVWTKERTFEVIAGDKDSIRELYLEDHQRVVVEPVPTLDIIWDKEQNAAVKVPANTEERAIELKRAEEQKKIDIEKEENQRRRVTGEAALAELERQRTSLGNPVPPETPPTAGRPSTAAGPLAHQPPETHTGRAGPVSTRTVTPPSKK